MLSSEKLKALLAEFQRCDQQGTTSVPAACVDDALKRSGILSSAEQDQALLLLFVNGETGNVGYSRLRDEVEIAARNIPVDPVKSISQQDLVFKLVSELRELFNKFDIGRLSLQGFRDGLAKLGFKETYATKELLRHSYEMTFHQLVQSLTRVDEREGAVQEQSNIRRGPPRRGIFDEERSNEVKMSLKSTARGQRPEGAFVTTVPHRHPDPESKDENMLSGDGTDQHPSQSFMTTSQMSSSPLRGKEQPQTSAGYDTRDKGLLRQQVHALIRRLDAGEYDGKVFARKLFELGISPPETALRLLDRHSTGGNISFKDWVKAFEPFFEEKTFHDVNQEGLLITSKKSDRLEDNSTEQVRRLRGQFGPRTGGSIFGGQVYGDSKETTLPRGQALADRNRSTPNILVPQMLEEPQRPTTGYRTAAKGHPTSSRPDFLCWSEQDQVRPPVETKKPMRAQAPIGSYKPPPFAREGDAYVHRSVTGIPRSPEKRESRRVPFGTEADYAASFANGVAPSFG
jgi:hypothetical protein